MDEIGSITVGVGFRPRTGAADDGSERAARQAAWIARHTGASVTILTAAWADDGGGPIELASSSVDELDGLAADMTAEGIDVRVKVVESHPWLALVREAIEGRADLVVAGKRASVGDTRRRIGSTSIKLLRQCPAPVWLVAPDHDLNHRHVLAATDFSDVSNRAVEAAAWITARSSGELHVFHAWNLTQAQLRAAPDLPEEDYDGMVEERRARAQAGIEREVDGLDVDPTLQVERGAAHTELLREAEEEHPDLIVMGSLSQGGRPGFLVGATAERIIEQVDESLLTFKPRDFVSPVEAGEAFARMRAQRRS